MGWASGAGILIGVARKIDPYLPSWDAAEDVYGDIIHMLEQDDCDTLDECFGFSKYLDHALKIAGYHMWTDDCRWLEAIYSGSDICACGWRP